MNNWELLTEATIDSIYFDHANSGIRIEISTVWEDKKRKQIVASGVDDFVINEMKFSNIIDRINLFNCDDIESNKREMARRLFFLLRGVEPSQLDFDWGVLHEKIESIRNGSLIFMEIEPVYGATILILAKHIELQTI